MNQLSAKTWLSIEALLPMLAMFLPTIIDFLTPDGAVPADGGQGGLGQIGDILGGLLGGQR